MQQKIVITGGPSSGKTSLINALTNANYTCMPEISREITRKAQKKGIAHLFKEDPVLFSKLLLEGREKQYEAAEKSGAELVFFDRGIPDVLAYLKFNQVPYPEEFDDRCAARPYQTVFILPPWEEIHLTDNERYEDFDTAAALFYSLSDTYKAFGHKPLLVPKGTVKHRMAYILNRIENHG